MTCDLIEFWRQCSFAEAPFVHPKDRSVLERNDRHIHREPQDFDKFISALRFDSFKDKRFHLSLLPTPYGGNIQDADIFVLLLNPGLSFTDYHAETRVPGFRCRLKRVLKQDFEGIDFPLMWLDPEYCWHSGFVWWERKLRKVAVRVAEEKGVRYLDALRDLSRRLAYIELIPYHSQSFGASRLINDLCSAKAAKRFASDILSKAASNGEKSIIVTRKAQLGVFPKRSRTSSRTEERLPEELASAPLIRAVRQYLRG